MKKVAIVTDSNSGITRQQAAELGIYVIPMPFMLGGESYFEGVNLSQEEFYQKLLDDSQVSTSQPAVGVVLEQWDSALKDYEQLVYIPMSSGLSASYETAQMLSLEYNTRVQVVDNKRVSVTLERSVLDALELAGAGWDALCIKEYLEANKFESSIYIMVNTLKYLKRGGRITPAAAAIGSMLNIKPVLQIQGDKLDSYAKARGVKQARRILTDAMSTDFNGRFSGYSTPEHMWLYVAYSYDKALASEFEAEVLQIFPNYEIVSRPLPLSVSCHIGPGALAIACSKKLDCL